MKHTTNTSKVLILAIALLGMSISALQAQTGRVGVNTDTPKATLEVKAKTNGSSQTEGVLIPRLTGDELKNMPTANIETSTMVFATSAATAPLAAHAVNLTSAGYFYYDGTVWVRLLDKVEAPEWIYKPTTERIDLKRSNTSLSATPAFKNYVYYDKNGYFKNYTDETVELLHRETATVPPFFYTENMAGVTSNTHQIKTSKLGISAYAGHANAQSYERVILVADKDDTKHDFIGISEKELYVDKETTLDHGWLGGQIVKITHVGQGEVGGLSPLQSFVLLSNKSKAKDVYGMRSKLTVDDSSSVSNRAVNYDAVTRLRRANSSINSLVGFCARFFDQSSGGSLNTVSGVTSDFRLSPVGSSNIGKVSLLQAAPRITLNNQSNVTKLIGFEYHPNFDASNTTTQIGEEYGIYLDDVSKGTTSYAIYTNAGTVRFGDSVGIGTSTPTEKLQVNGGNILVKTTTSSGGTPSLMLVKDTQIGNDPGAGRITIANEPNPSPYEGKLVFQPRLYNTASSAYEYQTQMVVGHNIGIGTANPTKKLEVNGTIKATKINFTGLPTYADDATAGAGGLVAGDCYKTATGELRIKL